MAKLTKTIQATTQTVNGEITVNLNLNISLDKLGNVSVEKEDKINLEIPDMDLGDIIDFGK